MFATSNEVIRVVVMKRNCVVWCMAREIPITIRIGHAAFNCCMRKRAHTLCLFTCLSLSVFHSLLLCTFVTDGRLFFAFASSLSLPSPLIGVYLCFLCSCVPGDCCFYHRVDVYRHCCVCHQVVSVSDFFGSVQRLMVLGMC